MNIIFTGDQIFLLTLAIIFAIMVIIIVVEWRKNNKSRNDIILLEKKSELKKIELVEKDLELKQRKENLCIVYILIISIIKNAMFSKAIYEIIRTNLGLCIGSQN